MIVKKDTKPEFYIDENCYIQELFNSPLLSEHLSVAHARVMVGEETKNHQIKGLEIYYILQGRGLVTLGNGNKEVGVGDLVYIEAGAPQKIKNIGDVDLIFLCICQPRFRQDDYTLLE